MKVEHCDICHKENADTNRRLYVGKHALPEKLPEDQKNKFASYMVDLKPVEGRTNAQRDVEALCDDCFLIWLHALVQNRLRSTSEAIYDMLMGPAQTVHEATKK